MKKSKKNQKLHQIPSGKLNSASVKMFTNSQFFFWFGVWTVYKIILVTLLLFSQK